MPVEIHTNVRHNRYGKGEVIRVTDDKIYVLFGKNQRIFSYPEAFEKGYLMADVDSVSIENTNANSQNSISDSESKMDSSAAVEVKSKREITIDAAEDIHYTKIFEAINATVGTDYTGWMQASWPSGNKKLPFRLWFPKLAETKRGELVSAAFDCVNTISEDWNELIFDDLKDTPPEAERDTVSPPVLIFAKEPKGGPYIFRGVFLKNKKKSTHRHHVYDRIGTRVRLIGQPTERVEILDDFRN